MPDLEILKQMIKKSALVEIKIKYNKKTVTLTEPQHPDSSVTITGLLDDTIVIKVDAFISPDSVFTGAYGECKRADYVIIANTGTKKCVLYIEIKKTKDTADGVKKQLYGAMCFVRYCQEIGKTFWNDNNFLNDYKHRFISFGHTGIPKRRTRIERQPSSSHDSPERMMKVDWPNYMQFNHLAGV